MANEPAASDGVLIGYARVSTDDQDLSLQLDALAKAGVAPRRIFQEKASGAADERPAFLAAFRALRRGDTLVVWKLDRLGRRLSRLISTIERLKEKGVHLRVLTEAIDTTTPTGILMFHIIGAFAEFERNMGIERTKAGLAAARARGRVGGRRRTITPDMVEELQRLVRDEAEGGEGLAVRDAAKRIGISASAAYLELRRVVEEEANDDLSEG
jgi:DNA invertase Pin-like site-specific DNA recombinase